ncbi:MAG: HAD-IIA family hydrolase [Anaerolineaceae bacterium]
MNNKDFGLLKEIEMWLLDMDGTIYLDEHLIDGAQNFLHFLIEKKKQFLFLTNNSSKSAEAYVQKLHRLGLAFVEKENVYTSGQATVSYLLKHFPNKKIFLLGTPELKDEFIQSKIDFSEDPDMVVLGFDTTLTYEKLWKTCDLIRKGLPYIATHPDLNCPIKDGFMPDIGSIMAFVKASTGREPDVVIGKPNLPILQAISEKFTMDLSKVAMVGDRLYTDIAMGEKGIRTVLVLSGETKLEDLQNSPFQPDLVVQSVRELIGKF